MRQDREKPDTELTAPHRELITIIQEIGLQVIAEYPVGPYKLDCYLPEYHLGIEADGPNHWKSRDRKRANALYDNYGISVMHLADIAIANREYTKGAIQAFAQDFEDSIIERRMIAKRTEEQLRKRGV